MVHRGSPQPSGRATCRAQLLHTATHQGLHRRVTWISTGRSHRGSCMCGVLPSHRGQKQLFPWHRGSARAMPRANIQMNASSTIRPSPRLPSRWPLQSPEGLSRRSVQRVRPACRRERFPRSSTAHLQETLPLPACSCPHESSNAGLVSSGTGSAGPGFKRRHAYTGCDDGPFTFTLLIKVQPPPEVGRPLPLTKPGICASGSSWPPNSSDGNSKISSSSPNLSCQAERAAYTRAVAPHLDATLTTSTGLPAKALRESMLPSIALPLSEWIEGPAADAMDAEVSVAKKSGEAATRAGMCRDELRRAARRTQFVASIARDGRGKFTLLLCSHGKHMSIKFTVSRTHARDKDDDAARAFRVACAGHLL